MSTPPPSGGASAGSGLLGLVVSRPVATVMIAIAAAVFGWVSYQRLPLNLMPDLAYPTITVRTEVPGYAPEEVESQVSRPIEEALATTAGLGELESRSRAGISDVVLEFAWGTDMDEAAQSIRERLQVTFLPPDADRPLILRYDPSLDPILRIGLSVDPEDASAPRGQEALYLLREVGERELKRELEAMDGVAAVRVRGGLEREVLVEAREDWLAARGITIEQLVQTLGSENVNIPGGTVQEGDNAYLVRTLNELRTVAEIRELEIRRADGVRVPVSQVATVTEVHKDREVLSKLDGREAVELEVYKAADANVVKVAEAIKARLGVDAPPPGEGAGGQGAGGGMGGGEGMDGMPQGPPTLKSQLPDGVTMVVLDDQAHFIEASLANLRSTALLGAFLAVAVLFLFLRDFRATAIIGTAIPLSIICTFAPMYLGGVSLNLMSLGGLALGIGMLVDNAVVVLENIHVYRERGASRAEAAVRGAEDVAAAVTASTLTTVSVFLPIAFVEGVAGQVFGDLALAVVFSLLARLVVALLFVPMLAALDFSGAAAAVREEAEEPRLLRVSRAARFRSFAQLREAWRSRGWGGRLLRLPYWLLRLVVRLSFELLAFVVAVPSALVARVVAVVLAAVVPRLARLALWVADRFQDVYGAFARLYERRLHGVLEARGLVLGLALLSVVVSLPVGGSLGQALIPDVHQGRFSAELSLPVGTPLGRTADIAAAAEAAVRGHPDVSHVHTVVGTERRADSKADEGEHTAKVTVELTPGGDLEQREQRVMADVRRRILGTLGPDDPTVELRLARPSLFTASTPVEVQLFATDLGRLRAASQRAEEAISALPGLEDVRSSLQPGYPEVRIRYDRDLLHRFGLDTNSVASRVQAKVQGETATSLSRGEGRLDLVVRLEEDQRRGLADLRRLNVNPAVTPPIPLESVATFELAEGPSEIRRVDQRRAAVVSANLEGFDLSEQAAAIARTMQGLGLEGVEWSLAGQNREMERSLTSLQLALTLAVFLVYVIMASTFESFLHPFVILGSVPLALVGVVGALWLADTPVSVVVLIGAIVLAGVVVNNAIVLVDTINRLRADGMERLEAVHAASALRLRPILITTTTTVLGLLPLAFGVGEGAEIQQPLALTVIAGLSSSTLLTLVVIPVVYLALTGRLERGERAGEAPSADASPEPTPEPAP